MSTEERNDNVHQEEDSTHGPLENRSFLCVVSALMLLVVVVYGALTWLVVVGSKPEEVPPAVQSFLDLAIVEDKLDDAVGMYIASADYEAHILPDTPGTDLINFETILHGYTVDVAGYEYRTVYAGYVEFLLLNSSGDEIYPAVGLAYELTNDGSQIKDYNLCRLQPFSQRDAEYSEYWS